MDKYKQFAELIKGLKKVYLAGGIQNAHRPDSWRTILEIFFEVNGIEAFNPVANNAEIFNQSILGYHEDDGRPILQEELQEVDEIKEAILYRQTERNDKRAIKECGAVIFYLDDRIGHGTMKEFDWSYDWQKPVIIIRRCPIKDLAHWNKWRRYFGLVVGNNMIEFHNITETKNFFVKELGFKEVGNEQNN